MATVPNAALPGRRQAKNTTPEGALEKAKAAALAASPQWQYVLLFTIVVLEYVRPMDWALKFLSPLRLGGIATLVMVFVFLKSKKDYFRDEPVHGLALAFTFVMAITIVFAPNTRMVYNTTTTMLWTYASFLFPIQVILCNKERLFKFFHFWVGIQLILAFLVVKDGGHGPGSYLWDENDVALALNMAIPYFVFLAQFPGASRKRKILLYGGLLLMIASIGITLSRGGVVGLAALILVTIALSKKPVRNFIVTTVAAAILVTVIVKVMPPSYTEDMANIDNPEDKTADERLWSWSIGWVMFKENPVLGVGAGNYPWTNHLYATKSPMYTPSRKIMGGRQAHSLYFTLLPELGLAGLVIFGAVFVALVNRFRTVRAYVRKQENPSDDSLRFELLFKAMLASAFAYLVTGAFISVLYYPPFWHLVAMATVTYRVARLELPGFPQHLGKERPVPRMRVRPAPGAGRIAR